MPKQNRTRYAILGLLSFAPLSGYDIRKICEEKLGYFWSESYSQIYSMLKQLTKEGFTTIEHKKQESKPDRKVYTVTDSGLQELRRWLQEPPAPGTRRIELLLKLTFGIHASSETMKSYVMQELDQIKAMNAELRELEQQVLAEKSESVLPLYQLITLRYGIAVTNGLID